MAKVLITGGAGYIGSHAVYAFLDAGYDVAVVDDLSTGVRNNIPADLPFYEGDVGDRTFINDVLRRLRPDGVLHFAGSIIVPESVADPSKYYRNNTVAGLTLIEACLAAGVTKFVFSSTAAVYGIPETGIAKEGSPLCPINPYGRSKLFVEQLLADISAAHDFRYAALRYFNVAGADPAGRTGQSTPQATHLIKTAAEVVVGRRKTMSLFGTDYDTPDGTCVRDFIHVTDLADAHRTVFEALDHTPDNLVLNCGNGRGYSVREIIHAMEKVAGHPLAIEETGRRAGDSPKLIADVSKLRNRIAWKPRFPDAETMVKGALDWERHLQQRDEKVSPL